MRSFLDRNRVDEHANGDVRFLIARGGVLGLERERHWFVSTCCRVPDGDGEGIQKFSEASRIITKQPHGAKASVALLELGYCPQVIRLRLRHGLNLQPWCTAALESNRAWLRFQFGFSPY